MFSRPKPGSDGRGLQRSGVLAFLAAFLVVDIVLVVFALHRVSSPSTGSGDGRTRTTRVDVPPASHESWSGARVMISTAEDGTVVRAVAGQCNGGQQPRVAVSSDTGATFQRSRPKVGRVLAIASVSDRRIRIIAADTDCKVHAYVSDDLGATWTRTGAGSRWRLALNRDRRVQTPRGPSQVGCEVRGLDVVNPSVARVVCARGALRTTVDAGRNWSRQTAPKSVQAIAYVTRRLGYAIARTETCGAPVYVTRRSGTNWISRSCLDGETVNGMAATRRVVFVGVDGHLLRSIDGGVHWELV